MKISVKQMFQVPLHVINLYIVRKFYRRQIRIVHK